MHFKNLEGKFKRESSKRTISTNGIRARHRWCANENSKPPKGWILRSHVSWRGERNIPYKGLETSPKQTCFKNLEEKLKRESSKRTISTSDGFGLLQPNLTCHKRFKKPLYPLRIWIKWIKNKNLPGLETMGKKSCYEQICICEYPTWGKQKEHLRGSHIVFQETEWHLQSHSLCRSEGCC